MPAKPKAKTKIKVEEIQEDIPAVEEPAKPEPKAEPVVETQKSDSPMPQEADVVPPKITSFSQLDSQKPTEPSVETTTKSILEPPEEPQEKEPELPKSTKPETLPPQVVPPDKSLNAETTQAGEESASTQDIKEWLKEVRPDTTQENEKTKRLSVKRLFVILAAFLFIGVVVGGLLYLKKNPHLKLGDKVKTVSETPLPSEAPSDTPQPVDWSKITVSILNGSGKKGEASKVKDLVVSAGVNTENVSTGNAKSYDYTKTEIQMKKDMPEEVYTKISESLSGNYSIEKASENLPDNSNFDVIIIVGSSK